MEKSDWESQLELLTNKVVNSGEQLTEKEFLTLRSLLDQINNSVETNIRLRMEIGRLFTYENLKENGKNIEEIQKYYEDDNQTIVKAREVVERNITIDHNQMFGYPANLSEDSAIVSYLRYLESKMYLMNSCGDAYYPGNYNMNNSKEEIAIIEAVKENLCLPANKYWGYINSGGTEGNFWGIREGLFKYPNGIFYYSDASHYSVQKFADLMMSANKSVIKTNFGKMDIKELFNKIIYNWSSNESPAIILLSFGTTALGSMDDIVAIRNELKKLKISNYIHVDAAMYGGIPKNQIATPMRNLFPLMDELDIDSISISLHKYLGNHQVNGILLSKTRYNQKFIDYIGQKDMTISGSRSFPSFSALQRIKEKLERNDEKEYYMAVTKFKKILDDNGIKYLQGDEFSNTFVIDKPSDEICKKYQLSTFRFANKECAHIIIFPYHKEEYILDLINDIIGSKQKNYK